MNLTTLKGSSGIAASMSVAALLGLAACGGSTGTAGGTAPANPPTAPGDQPVAISTTTATTKDNRGTQVRAVGGRGQIEEAVVLSGRLAAITADGRTTIDPISAVGLPPNVYSDGSSNLYAISADDDDVTFAVVGWRIGSVFEGNTLGGLVRAPRGGHPTSGSATYSGDYTGFFTTASVPTNVTGDVAMTVDFDSDRFASDITNRVVGSGIGRNFVTPSVVEQSVSFSGTVNADGLLRGGHRDGNSIGSMTAQTHGTGAVGLVDIDHSGGGNAAQPDTLEVGTFVAN